MTGHGVNRVWLETLQIEGIEGRKLKEIELS